MRTAISLPDELVSAANALARRLGVSRDELYAAAISEFLTRHAEGEITARLDNLYAGEPSALDPNLRRAQRLRYARLAEACALLDPAEERALAEEGLGTDLDTWPEH